MRNNRRPKKKKIQEKNLLYCKHARHAYLYLEASPRVGDRGCVCVCVWGGGGNAIASL